MADIRVDFAALERVRSNLRHISDIMERPGREMEHVNGDSMGVIQLASRMNSFGEEWSYGIKQISKFSGSAIKSLNRIEKAFTELDDKLAKELKKSQNGS
ncbi:hypothetical protein [Streptomyces sp. Iso 434]|uniref:hypothetical protein n=1 Tax=Streptomyces sp. Iso 434 TaxID=3062272 RepID=UPI00397E9A42